jgi:hypothetical protein
MVLIRVPFPRMNHFYNDDFLFLQRVEGVWDLSLKTGEKITVKLRGASNVSHTFIFSK